jgi:cell wall-associated NlpC family hydrolase
LLVKVFTKRAIASLFLAAAMLLPQLGAVPASADPVADARAKARRLAAELDRLGERLSVLDEAYNNARLRLDAAQARVATAQARAQATQHRYDTAVQKARQRAVAAYVDGGSLGTAVLLPAARDARDLSVRREYLRAAAGDDRAAIDELKAAREDLAVERAGLDKQIAAARAAAASVKASRDRAASAVSQQRRLLAQAQGELAQQVAAEQTRRAAEAAAQARAAITARQAREAAAGATRTASPGRASRSRDVPGPSDADVGPPPPASSGADAAVAFARRQVGKSYQWGGDGPDAYDCSGLTMMSWRAGGVSLPHSSSAQYSATTRVPMSALEPGDLLFYGSPIHHVGIYVGGGTMVEAPHEGVPVRYASIYRSDLVGAGRPG